MEGIINIVLVKVNICALAGQSIMVSSHRYCGEYNSLNVQTNGAMDALRASSPDEPRASKLCKQMIEQGAGLDYRTYSVGEPTSNNVRGESNLICLTATE
jgi:hypothetical protein